MEPDTFPACPVEGPILPPVPFNHLGLEGAVPSKCGACDLLFEGSCRRYGELTQRYLDLDHGYCGVPGDTDPVFYSDDHVDAKVRIPRKCASCRFVALNRTRGFECRKDHDLWGDFPRSLDWGDYQPDELYVSLPSPKITTRPMRRALARNDLLAFVQEHRRVNPDRSLTLAREDYAWLRAELKLDRS